MTSFGECPGRETHVHQLPYETVPHLTDYDPLERLRLRRLRLEPRYARWQDSVRMIPRPPLVTTGRPLCRHVNILPQHWTNTYDIRAKVLARNTLSPFTSMQKVYWGPFFRDDMDHRLMKHMWVKPYWDWEVGVEIKPPLPPMSKGGKL